MLEIVFRPEKAPVVRGDKLYAAVANRSETLFRVRARNADEALRKVMAVFRHELAGKTVDFNLSDFPAYDVVKGG